MKLDWAYTEKARQQHNKASPHLEPSREKKTWKAQELLEEGHHNRNNKSLEVLEGDRTTS
jgi:hypothetical protein